MQFARVYLLTIAAVIGLSCAQDLAAGDPLERFGVPEGTVIKQGAFEFAFDGRTREPRWTLELLDRATIDNGKAVRDESFTSDQRIYKPLRVSDADYDQAGYDRGHLAPADDYGHVDDHRATFLLTNCVPQNATLNRGLWLDLEKQIRDGIQDGDRCWVLTVPLFERGIGQKVVYDTVGPHDVAVPTHLAKAILLLHPNRATPDELPAWIIPNKTPPADASPDDYSVPLGELEEAAGLEIWSELDAKLKHELARK
jgi:endonuclease G